MNTPRLFAETNLPLSREDTGIGDQYLQRLFDRSPEWRWSSPEYNQIKQENNMLNQGMTFECEGVSLDSFAAYTGRSGGSFGAFAVFGDDATDGLPTSDDYAKMYGFDPGTPSSPKPTASVAPGSTGNTAINILSGLVRDITPVATQAATTAAQKALGYKPAAAATPQSVYRSTPTAAASKSSNTPLLIAGGLAVVAILFLTMK